MRIYPKQVDRIKLYYNKYKFLRLYEHGYKNLTLFFFALIKRNHTNTLIKNKIIYNIMKSGKKCQ